MTDAPKRITELLRSAVDGDKDAVDVLYRELQGELKRIARSKMRQASPGGTLQTTALVNEAYLHLAARDATWENRRHFFFAVARAMQDILIDQARRKASQKRGGAWRRISADDLDVALEAPAENMLALDEALSRLDEQDPAKAQLVRLRFFAGLSEQEAATVLGVSRRTVQREWRVVRALLYRELAGADEEPHENR